MISDSIAIFQDKHLEILSSIFRTNDADLPVIIKEIEDALHYLEYVKFVRSSAPDIEVVRERMRKTANAAEELYSILKAEPFAEHLFNVYTYDMFKLKEDRRRPGYTFTKADLALKLILEISQKSRSLLADDEMLRLRYAMPDRRRSNQNIISYGLWPSLFKIYHERKGKIGKSVDGPLKRVVAIVHDAAGLPQVVGPTLKRAAAEWSQDKARSPEGGALTGQSSP